MKYRAIVDRIDYDAMGAEPLVMDSYDARLLKEVVELLVKTGKYVAKVYNVFEAKYEDYKI